MDVFVALLVTVVLLFAIVWACAIFTNAIEWIGHRFQLSEGAVGSVLAAVGTALPETLVPIVALLGGVMTATTSPEQAALLAENAEHIGIGAILGAPFLLSTLGMAIVGLATFFYAGQQKRGVVLHLDLNLFKRDLTYFFAAYGAAFTCSFLPWQNVKYGVAIGLILLYALYVKRTLSIEHIPDEEFHLDPLTIAPKSAEPPTGMIILQTLMGLGGILVMAHLFVHQITTLSHQLGISSLVLSLIIAPIATELPEKFNSFTWIGKKKDNLAMGNITGAMVFQSCIPTAVGLAFTPWILDDQGQLSVALCFLTAGFIFANVHFNKRLFPSTLLVGLGSYLIFIFYSFYKIMQGGF